MTVKFYVPEGEPLPESQIGSALESLASTIHGRRGAGEESYTYRLLRSEDLLLKKLVEEAHEATLAAKDIERLRALERQGSLDGENAASHTSDLDAAVDHLRYEAGDVLYHLLVLLERYEIPLDEFAAEMNSRMDAVALASRGAAQLHPAHINRGR